MVTTNPDPLGYSEGKRALKDAANRLLGDDPLFDSDYDNALVAAYLIEIAEGER